MVDQLFGMWDLDGRGYDRPGVLCVDHAKKTLVLEFDVYGEDVSAPDPYEDGDRLYVRGKLTDGRCITLYRCQLFLQSASANPHSPKHVFRYKIKAMFAFLALEIRSEQDLI